MASDAQSARTSNASGHLDIAVQATGEHTTVALTGELDVSAAPEVTSSLEGLTAGAKAIVLDIDSVSFIDSAGLRCILVCEELCRDAGVALRLTRGSERVRRVFQVTGLIDHLPALGPSSAGGD
jgi:anti-sigma B factor antagonist